MSLLNKHKAYKVRFKELPDGNIQEWVAIEKSRKEAADFCIDYHKVFEEKDVEIYLVNRMSY